MGARHKATRTRLLPVSTDHWPRTVSPGSALGPCTTWCQRYHTSTDRANPEPAWQYQSHSARPHCVAQPACSPVHIAVNQSLVMSVLERVCHLLDIGNNRRQRNPLSRGMALAQRAIGGKVHHPATNLDL